MVLSKHSENPCEILCVIGTLNIGGAERHIVDVAPALAALGYRVAVYCLSERGAMAHTLADAGIEVIGPPFEAGTLLSGGRLGSYLALGSSALRLFTLLLTRRPAIVFCLLPMANIVGIFLGRLSLTKRIIASRRSLNRYQARQRLVGWAERQLNRYAHAVVSNSHAGMRELLDEGVSPARVTVIHNGIPLGRMTTSVDRSQIRALLGIVDDALVFVIVANLIAYKGHLDLVAALAGISGVLPEKWTLLVVGRDDGVGPSLLDAARSGEIERHIRLVGPRTDIPQLLRAADVAVLSSHEEGFPTAVLEYMIAGLPVVATDIGGTGEAVSDGETGYLVPPRDPQALGAALLRLANDRAARRSMGAAGRARACELFTLEACVAAYNRLFQGLVCGLRR